MGDLFSFFLEQNEKRSTSILYNFKMHKLSEYIQLVGFGLMPIWFLLQLVNNRTDIPTSFHKKSLPDPEAPYTSKLE